MTWRDQQNRIAIIIIIVVIFAWFSPWWAGGRMLAPLDLQNRMMSPWSHDNRVEYAKNHIVSDCVDQYLVYRKLAEKSLREEGWIGWSDLTYGGTAEYANTMALYFDWTVQLHRWFDFNTAWHLGLMGQVLLAALGMFAFLKGRQIRPAWSCCGALIYAANSQFVTWIYHRWALGSFCWLPWILWAIDSYRKGRRSFWPIVPLFIAMSFLGGTLQHAALVALAIAALWLEEAIAAAGESSVRKPVRAIRAQLPLLGRYLAWGLLGTGLASMMLLPCADAFLTSNRLGLHTGMTINAGNSVYPHGPLQPLFNLAAYPFQIFPSVLGRCDSVDVLKLFKSELFYIAYFGSIPVIVAFLALWRKQSPVLARVLIGFGLLLPLTPLVRLLYQRLLLLFIFGGILAFAHFMESASRETRLKLIRFTAIPASLAAAIWTVVSCVLHFRPNLAEAIHRKIVTSGDGSSFGHFHEWIILRADRFVSDLMIWSPQQLLPLFLLAAALAGLYWTASRTVWTNRLGTCLLATALIAEVSLFGSRWIVWTNPETDPMFPTTAESRALSQHVGRDGRTTTLIHPSAHMALTPFIPNTLIPYGVAAIGGYDSIIPNGMILPNESPGDSARLGRLGVTHLITWQGNPNVPSGWAPVWNSPRMALYENPTAVSRYIGFHSRDEMNEFFANRNSRYIRIGETSGLQNSRNLRVQAGVEWIRVAENHASGWQYRRAKSSDEWQEVARAPDASMLLEVNSPEGLTEWEMRYNPPLRAAGLTISGISLIITALVGVVTRRNLTQHPRESNEIRSGLMPR